MRRWWFLLLVVVAAYGLSGVVQVRPGERGVVRRFGQLLPNRLEPGLSIQLPWGMDRVDRVAVDRVQSVAVGYQEDDLSGEAMPAGQLLTGDHNFVNVQAILTYSVQPGEEAEYVVQADRVDAPTDASVESVMAQWVAGRTVDDVLLNGKNEMRPVLKEQTRQWIEPYRLGVQILDVRVALIAPPTMSNRPSTASPWRRRATRRYATPPSKTWPALCAWPRPTPIKSNKKRPPTSTRASCWRNKRPNAFANASLSMKSAANRIRTICDRFGRKNGVSCSRSQAERANRFARSSSRRQWHGLDYGSGFAKVRAQ